MPFFRGYSYTAFTPIARNRNGWTVLAPIPELGYLKSALLLEHQRPLYWVGSSKQDLIAMPQPVVRTMGMALGVAQQGGKHPAAKRWKGEGAGVLEIVRHFDTDTFRAVYAVSFGNAVYVLHCFQKKSPRGVKTARTDVALVRKRLKVARADHEARYGKDSK